MFFKFRSRLWSGVSLTGSEESLTQLSYHRDIHRPPIGQPQPRDQPLSGHWPVHHNFHCPLSSLRSSVNLNPQHFLQLLSEPNRLLTSGTET